MAKMQFEITQAGHETIRIEADDGVFVDDWRELTANTCLIMSAGGFKRHADKTVFAHRGEPVLTLFGDPLGSDTQGTAVIDLADNGCPSQGWRWRRL